jgi:23S rRNA (uracil1939-C5)-methyltransferase
MLDAYAGVGLFGALLGGDRPLTAIESNPSSAADARVNIPAATIIESQVEKWQPSAMSTVIADPARSGLDRKGVNTLVATGAAELVLVSCDPASLGRDAGLLAAGGYQLDHVTVVDLFGQTSHVEAVSLFVRD